MAVRMAVRIGTRVSVDGMGEGTYTNFKASWIGANTHTIEFDSGETKRMRLSGVDWRVISEPAVAEEPDVSVAADSGGGDATEPPPVPDSTPPVVVAASTGGEEVQEEDKPPNDEPLDAKHTEKQLSAIENALEADRNREEAKAAAEAKAAWKAAAKAAKEAAKKDKANAMKWQKLLVKLEKAAEAEAEAEAKRAAAAAKEAERLERQRAKEEAAEERAAAKVAAAEAKREEKGRQLRERQASRVLLLATKLANNAVKAKETQAGGAVAKQQPLSSESTERNSDAQTEAVVQISADNVEERQPKQAKENVQPAAGSD